MKNHYLIYVDIFGDDWQDTERFIEDDKSRAEFYKSIEYRQQQLSINGIENITVSVEEKTPLELQDILSFNEWCDLYPEVKDAIDEILEFRGINGGGNDND